MCVEQGAQSSYSTVVMQPSALSLLLYGHSPDSMGTSQSQSNKEIYGSQQVQKRMCWEKGNQNSGV